MGWSEGEVVCFKHRDHKQQPGVCSCCLREELSKLALPNNLVFPSVNQFSSSSNSSSPTNYYYYSSGHSSSTYMSPSGSRRKGHHHRSVSDVLSSFSFVSGNGGFRKSSSIAFVAARDRDGGNDGNNSKKKKGFWSNLIKSTSKRTKEALVLPRMKERLVYTEVSKYMRSMD